MQYEVTVQTEIHHTWPIGLTLFKIEIKSF